MRPSYVPILIDLSTYAADSLRSSKKHSELFALLTRSRHWIVVSILLAALIGLATYDGADALEQRVDLNACLLVAEAQESFAESQPTSSDPIDVVPASLPQMRADAAGRLSPRPMGGTATLGDPRAPQAARAPPHEFA